MKKEFVIIFFIAFLLSCQKSELEYSCDPVINKFVIEHKIALSVVTVNDLSSYDLQLQRAIFNSWDYQKKRSAWIDKFNYVMIHIPFSESEISHIQLLISHINEDYFLKENLENNLESRSSYATDWINYSIDTLHWSNQFIAFMVFRLYTDQAQFDLELSLLRTINRSLKTNSEIADCSCNISVDFCDDSLCRSSNCNITTGCGSLWQMPCDGHCF